MKRTRTLKIITVFSFYWNHITFEFEESYYAKIFPQAQVNEDFLSYFHLERYDNLQL